MDSMPNLGAYGYAPATTSSNSAVLPIILLLLFAGFALLLYVQFGFNNQQSAKSRFKPLITNGLTSS